MDALSNLLDPDVDPGNKTPLPGGKQQHNPFTKKAVFYKRYELPDNAEDYKDLMTSLANDPTVYDFKQLQLYSPNDPSKLFIHAFWSTCAVKPAKLTNNP